MFIIVCLKCTKSMKGEQLVAMHVYVKIGKYVFVFYCYRFRFFWEGAFSCWSIFFVSFFYVIFCYGLVRQTRLVACLSVFEHAINIPIIQSHRVVCLKTEPTNDYSDSRSAPARWGALHPCKCNGTIPEPLLMILIFL